MILKKQLNESLENISGAPKEKVMRPFLFCLISSMLYSNSEEYSVMSQNIHSSRPSRGIQATCDFSNNYKTAMLVLYITLELFLLNTMFNPNNVRWRHAHCHIETYFINSVLLMILFIISFYPTFNLIV